MKIAITGTHSTGKSTFIGELCAGLAAYRVKVVGDLATEARERGFPILRDHTFASTIWMMARGVTLEQEAALHHDLVVVDRPIMEPIAYLRAALATQGRSVTAEEDACLHALARSYAFTYDMVVKTVVNPAIPISAEKERDHDPEFRMLADREIQSLYQRLDCPCVELRHGDPTARSNLVADIQSRLASRHARTIQSL
jgi:predicted ATPase